MSMAIDNNRKKNVAVFPNFLKKITIVLNRFFFEKQFKINFNT
jgi:hypothetical protein